MSRIPSDNQEYLKYLELCISALDRIEKDEVLKRPTVAKVISASADFLSDYRDDIKRRMSVRRRRS